jgi:hypothetical protein
MIAEMFESVAGALGFGRRSPYVAYQPFRNPEPINVDFSGQPVPLYVHETTSHECAICGVVERCGAPGPCAFVLSGLGAHRDRIATTIDLETYRPAHYACVAQRRAAAIAPPQPEFAAWGINRGARS